MDASAPRFPERLEEVPDQRRALETFGLGPSLVAVGLVWYAVSLAIGARAALDAAELGILGLLFAGAAACVGHELRQRARRLVLVAGDGGVGVYRRGVLTATLTLRSFAGCRADEPQPLKGLLILVAVAVLFLGYGFTEVRDAPSRLVALAPGVYVALLALSFARGAWLCASYRLDGGRTRALFAHADLRAAGVAPR